MTVAKWVFSSLNGAIPTGTALGDCAVVVPALGTIQRIVFNCVATASVTAPSTPGYSGPQGFYLLNRIYVSETGKADHNLHESWDDVPIKPFAIFDSTQVPPPVGINRIYNAVYSAGDRELGQNLKTSWGGPFHPNPMSVKLASGFFKTGQAAQTAAIMYYSLQLRVLYYK
jgi:hypothetical protein